VSNSEVENFIFDPSHFAECDCRNCARKRKRRQLRDERDDRRVRRQEERVFDREEMMDRDR